MSIQPEQGYQVIGNGDRLGGIGMLEDDPRSTLKLWRCYHTLDFLSDDGGEEPAMPSTNLY
jgi:hypothetical protein